MKTYHTRAIITHSLYILNPLFEGQKRFFKEFFSENFAFMYDQYSRAVYNQERVIMARIQYFYFLSYFLFQEYEQNRSKNGQCAPIGLYQLDNMSIMAAGAVHFDRYRGIIEGKGLTLACPRMISQLSPSKNNLAIHIFLLFFYFLGILYHEQIILDFS